ncbi:chondroitin AC lyase [Spirosomataceae bacterium TFI 002]|nr:chondroitin AC lyase [Spirosomataceae bacterium TFI 002]
MIQFLKTLILFCLFLCPFDSTADDFDIIKSRVVNELLKEKVEKTEVEEIIKKLKSDGSFNDIEYGDLSRTAGFPHRYHTVNLEHLSVAYKQKGSPYFGDKNLLNSIKLGLTHWADKDYFGDNWHNNQISTPTHLTNIMLLVGDEMPKELVNKLQPIIGRANMNASGARPSGDRIVIAGILAKNLLFMNQKEDFAEIIKIIEGEVKFNTGERGMQHDYSFHHRVDRVNNTTSYGYGKYANAFGEWSYFVAGTSYAFSEKGIKHLVDYYLDGIYKQLVYGVYNDVSVQNRSITHKATFKSQSTIEIERLLLSTDYRKSELEEIIKLRKGEAKPSLSFAKFFWQTEHFVVQRPHYYTSVRMFSSRNRNMEVPYNGPGKPTHHRADGTNYVQLKGDEYLNIWPMYNWQQISGTTIMQKPELPSPEEIQKEGSTSFVGAVEDGNIGAVGYDFKSPHDNLVAKKSWFFFENEYVCLGNGIQSWPNLPVVTTINQTLLKSPVRINQNDKTYTLTNGKRSLDNVKWVLQDNIAYVLPQKSTLNISNQTESGTWASITDEKNVSNEIVKEEVFNIGFDHGNRPKDGSYAYVVIPGVTERKLLENVDRNIEILSNTKEIQAVKNTALEVTQVVFYTASMLQIDNKTSLSIDSPGIVMLKSQKGKLKEIHVSDPTRTLSHLSITLTGKYTSSASFESSYNAAENKTLFRIALPLGPYAGKSIGINL